MNALFDEKETKWVDDSSNNESTFTLSGSNCNEITLKSGKQGTPYNIMLQSSTAALPSSKDAYFEASIQNLKGSLAIGMATPSEFQPGWKTKGMFYNGFNITNGSAAKIVGFGPSSGSQIKNGDVIAVYMHQNGDDTMDVIFYHDGTCLGTAFHLSPASVSNFRPCLHVDGMATVAYEAPELIPTTMIRDTSSSIDTKSFDGDWEIKQCFLGPELGEYNIPEEVLPILSLMEIPAEAGFRLSIKVANKMNAKIALTEGEKDAKKTQDDGFTKITIGPVMSTMMMPPPDVYDFEKYLNESLPIFTKMIVSENGDLIMSGPTAEIICSRYVDSHDVLTEYH
uniref:B30.2/SPRY domain-containing protein n=1 Tax=Helicotheca tamesis TaxID=374047 RepID=A0A7S2H1Z7_9STRA|mmetsp:Transcript_14508/g.19850  ORF Transcript_14508/g.19850 Transcript_14508/m.19850 type:complete len:339 (+) Transcript_14508:142-1158(+)|eukprot:CAMPEP_0185738874 /NCGR_PEP_ID=MMETSP1171-20130828/34114_1 /TAXON_ID=374046 /ORGANISM="Helicotheca tamensis, Strain CCMP826" /LENGTH=338 /DNA_ID=CAMNT_0028410259 /DNA_START=119 /DNA_END=1135 /DNA_ORIENTATION=-